MRRGCFLGSDSLRGFQDDSKPRGVDLLRDDSGGTLCKSSSLIGWRGDAPSNTLYDVIRGVTKSVRASLLRVKRPPDMLMTTVELQEPPIIRHQETPEWWGIRRNVPIILEHSNWITPNLFSSLITLRPPFQEEQETYTYLWGGLVMGKRG